MGRDSICSFDWLYLPQHINAVFPHFDPPAVSINVSQQGPIIPSLLFRNQNLLVAGSHEAGTVLWRGRDGRRVAPQRKC